MPPDLTGSTWKYVRSPLVLSDEACTVPSPLMTQIHYLGQPLFTLGCADTPLYQLHSPLFHPHDAPQSIFCLASFFFTEHVHFFLLFG